MSFIVTYTGRHGYRGTLCTTERFESSFAVSDKEFTAKMFNTAAEASFIAHCYQTKHDNQQDVFKVEKV